jgi:hypothetical protein
MGCDRYKPFPPAPSNLAKAAGGGATPRSRPPTAETPATLARVLLLLALVLLLGGVIFLVTWDIPPPTARIEEVIPDERLPR